MSTRFIDTSSISTTAGFPFRGVTLDHLKNGNEDATNAFCKNMIGTRYFDPLKKYVISGCINSTPAGPAFTISSGFIFHSGFLFIVDATTFTPAIGETAVCVLDNIYETLADPTTFQDGSSHNVHVIRKIKIQSGVSGSGLVDFNDLIRAGEIKRRIVGDPGEPVFQNGWASSTSDKLSFGLDIQKNILYISGIIRKNPYNGFNEIVFQLPMDYPINETKIFFIHGNEASTAGAKIFSVTIFSAGKSVQISPEFSPFASGNYIINFNNTSLFLG